MKSSLAPTGSAELLNQLSEFVPDDFINGLLRHRGSRGPRSRYCPAQLFRVLLLALLSPVHSFNLLTHLLMEQRSWRRFALLRHRHRVPDAKVLHEFRQLCGVSALRQINRHLLTGLLPPYSPSQKTVALIDSTDLPAATSAFKKK